MARISRLANGRLRAEHMRGVSAVATIAQNEFFDRSGSHYAVGFTEKVTAGESSDREYISGGTGPTLWTPADLGAKCYAWYAPEDASTLTIVSGKVTAIAPKYGTGPTLTGFNDGTSYEPVIDASTFGSKASLDMSNKVLTTTALALGGTTALGYFISTRKTGSNFRGRLGSFSPVGAYDDGGTGAVGGIMMMTETNGRVTVYRDPYGGVDTGVAPTYPKLASFSFHSKTTGNTYLRENGTVKGEITHAATAYTATRFACGAQTADLYDNRLAATTLVGGMVITIGDLTPDEIARLEAFFAWDRGYQAELPANHRYALAAPTVATLWTPLELGTSAFVLGLRAMDTDTSNAGGEITRVSGAVSQWNDWSGHGNHFTQATSGARPTYSAALTELNGLPGAVWDGSDDFLMATVDYAAESQLTVFAVLMTGDYKGSIYEQGPSAFNEDFNFINFDRYWRAIVDTNPTNQAEFLSEDFTNPHLYAAAMGASLRAIYIDGYTRASNTTSQTFVGTSGQTRLGATLWDGEFSSMSVGEYVVIAGTLLQSDRELIEGYLAHKWGLAANLDAAHPYKTSAPTVLSGGGSSVYNDARTEAVTLTETSAGYFEVLAALTESGAAGESSASAMPLASAITESGAATEASTAPLVAVGARTESVAATESETGLLVIGAAQAESAAATESGAGVFSVPATLTESAAAGESSANGSMFNDARTESAASSDAQAAAVTVPVSRTESGAAADAATGLLTTATAITETAASSETSSGLAVLPVTRTESAAAGESSSGVLMGGVNVFLVETAAAGDSQSMQFAAAGLMLETALAADSLTVTQSAGVSLTETVAATESSGGGMPMAVAHTATAAATDAQVAGGAVTAALTEAVAASASHSALLGYAVAVTEALSAADAATTVHLMGAAQVEGITVLALQIGGLGMTVAQIEAALASDSAVSAIPPREKLIVRLRGSVGGKVLLQADINLKTPLRGGIGFKVPLDGSLK